VRQTGKPISVLIVIFPSSELKAASFFKSRRKKEGAMIVPESAP
jgi:hypothetical protein